MPSREYKKASQRNPKMPTPQSDQMTAVGRRLNRARTSPLAQTAIMVEMIIIAMRIELFPSNMNHFIDDTWQRFQKIPDSDQAPAIYSFN
jgi:hypothetical protein